MQSEIVKPVVSNFVKSLRDIGYSFEVAVADVLDNSITAYAKNVEITFIPHNKQPVFALLDDGIGMNNEELINAMRLATSDPDVIRDKKDLGRFGLGLKTASFSQCINLTVLSKKKGILSIKRWDLDYISRENEWLLLTPKINDCENLPLFNDLLKKDNGTLVIWSGIDTLNINDIPEQIKILREHLSLVFHCFLEGVVPGEKPLNITVNGLSLEPLNPFNTKHNATQQLMPEKLKYFGSSIIVQPFILPHHSKMSQQEFDKYATNEGYTKSQGFYLYRANRLLIHGTWWGLHKTSDAHKLVRIKIDIPNDQDHAWGIDIKKSTARPDLEIRKDLKRIIQQVTVKGSRPYTGRGRKIEDKSTTRFWELVKDKEEVKFSINRSHPLIENLELNLKEEEQHILNVIMMGLESYLPLDSIVAQLNSNPLKVNQVSLIDDEKIKELTHTWRKSGLSEDFIKKLLKTEVYKNKEDYFEDKTSTD